MQKQLTASNLSSKVVQAEYAVRGAIVTKAMTYETQLAEKPGSLPFSEIIYCNIGNPQQLRQKPLSFFRQVLALCEYPELLESSSPAAGTFPEDARVRARELLASMTSVGAYTASQGVPYIRAHVARFLQERDGHAADPADIFLTEGASQGVCHILELMIRDAKDTILCPIPQYPLYSAKVTMYGGSLEGYFLDEAADWGVSIGEIARAYDAARSAGRAPRSLVVINPGNPTGQVLREENMREIVRFCEERSLVLMADEVYQTNVYIDSPFVSFKKVVRDLKSPVELISFHSVSKGFVGECGHRGGYFELVNFDPAVREQIVKLASVNLCPNTLGQIAVDLMVAPPRAGEPSHAQYRSESDALFQSLKRRAIRLAAALNKIDGVSVNSPQGAMYLFVNVRMPPKAVDEAARRKVAPDFLYCDELLDQTGIVVVPGSGFLQVPGTHHFRTTFLPPEEQIDRVAEVFGKFHRSFTAKYN